MEDDLNRRIALFLEEASGWTHQWGGRDCLLFIADWIVARGGADPAAPWRGSYRSARGAARIIARAGGEAALLDDGLGRVGWRRLASPDDARAGDVGLAVRMTPRGPGPVGVVHVGVGWASLMARGVLAAPDRPLAAWGVR